MNPLIRIQGAHASLHNVDPGDVLPGCLRFLHPGRKHSAAFKRGDWDGYVSLFNGRQFPAGLWQLVEEHLRFLGHKTVDVRELKDPHEVDLSRLSDDFLVHPTNADFRLRDHQMAAIRAVLTNMRGVVQSPTGSGKTEMMLVAALYLWEEFGYRTLVVQSRKGVVRQMVDRARAYWGTDVRVGMYGDGAREMGDIVIATSQSLRAFRPRRRKRDLIPGNAELRELVKEFDVLMYDECHRVASETWYEIGMEGNFARRYGFSGTPLVGQDLRDTKLVAATGPVIFRTDTQTLIERGYAAKPKIVMVMSENASGPELPKQWIGRKARELPYAEAYQQGLVENPHHNRSVVRAVEWLLGQGRRTLVLCRRKEHFRTLSEMFDERGIQHLGVWGATEVSERSEAKTAFAEGRVRVLLATTIWDEAEDIAGIDALVLAEGIQVSTNTKQRIGRGMRPDSADVWVVDFVPTCHSKLVKHAHERALAYEADGHEVCVLEEWPAADEEADGDLLPFRDWDEKLDA